MLRFLSRSWTHNSIVSNLYYSVIFGNIYVANSETDAHDNLYAADYRLTQRRNVFTKKEC